MRFNRERRRFLGALAAAPFLDGLAGNRAEAAVAPSPPTTGSAAAKSLVARCRRDGLMLRGKLQDGLIDDVLAPAVSRAAGEESPVATMRSLFRPTDVVGLKVNCLAGRGLSPQPGFVHRLCDWLIEAGLPPKNIVIWDRTDRELKSAGYKIARSGDGVRCMGTEHDHDAKSRDWGPASSRFARILVEDFTALINVGVLKDHGLSGVSIGLKNWYGAIDNPNKLHGDGCAPYIPHLAAHPLIRKKLRLTVIDGSTAQCNGGPQRNFQWTWPWQGVLASTDPVAMDAVGWRMIEERRAETDLPSLARARREPTWIAAAAKLGLGRADAAGIRVEDL